MFNKNTLLSKAILINKLRVVIIASLLFSSAALYQKENHKTFISIFFILSAFTGIKIIFKPNIILYAFLKGITSKYIIWLFFIFLFFLLHAFIFPSFKEFGILALLSQCLIVFIIVIWVCDLNLNKQINLFIDSCIIASLILIIYYFTIELDTLSFSIMTGARFGSNSEVIRNSNYLAQYLLLFSTLTLYRFLFSKSKKLFLFVLYLLLILLTLLSGSKRVIIGVILIFTFLYYLKYKHNFLFYFVPLVVILSSFVYILLNNDILFNIAGQRLEGMFNFFLMNNISDNSTQIRRDLLYLGLDMISDKPILGHGFAYFETHSGLNSKVMTFHTHNNYLELLINYGIIGLTLYYSKFISIIIRLLRNYKSYLSYLFIIYLSIIFILLDTTSVTFYTLPINYLILYFASIHFEKPHNYLSAP